jgi:carboxypeptidase family protein
LADFGDTSGQVGLGGIFPGSGDSGVAIGFWVNGLARVGRTIASLAPGETRDLGDVVVGDAVTLRGRVLMFDGRPASSITVTTSPHISDDPNHVTLRNAVQSAVGRHTTADEEGVFMFGGLMPGRWDVYATYDTGHASSVAYDVDPSAGEVFLRLPRVGRLRGRVLDAHGRPVAGASVTPRVVDGIDAHSSVQVITDEEGYYEFSGFGEGSAVRLRVATHGNPDERFVVKVSGRDSNVQLK